MKEKLISIIVPVYNAEKYLKRCLDSILKQTYHNFEVIVINDGSTDNSLRMALKYEEKDSRIRVIDKKNEGVSKTRNRGLDEVSGEYLCFIDSDDYVENTFLEKLYVSIVENSSDLSVCLFKNVYSVENDAVNTDVGIKNLRTIDISEYLRAMSEKIYSVYYGALWNKMYKTEIVNSNNIRFDDLVDIGEDLIFNMKYIQFVHRISLINDYNYYYCQYRDDALTKNKNVWHWWEMAKTRLLFCEKQLKKMGIYDGCEINLDTALATELIAPTYDIIKSNYKGYKTAKEKLASLYSDDYIKKAVRNNQKQNMVHKIARLSIRLNNYGLFVMLMRVWIKIQRYDEISK